MQDYVFIFQSLYVSIPKEAAYSNLLKGKQT